MVVRPLFESTVFNKSLRHKNHTILVMVIYLVALDKIINSDAELGDLDIHECSY